MGIRRTTCAADASIAIASLSRPLRTVFLPHPMSQPDASPLARYPAEIQAAHARFVATGDSQDLQKVVEAAIRDYMPAKASFPPETVLADDLRLVEDLGFDSIAIAELVFFFEDLFKVTINNRDLQALQTIGELRAYITRNLDRKNPSA